MSMRHTAFAVTGPALLLAAAGCGADRVYTLGQLDPTPRFRGEVIALGSINSDDDDDNPTLTDDMLEIYFTSDRRGGGDVWWAQRDSAEAEFGAPELLAAASSDAEETSSAISPDGLTLWVGSRRGVEDDDEDNDSIDIWQTRRSSRGAAWGPLVNLRELNSDEDDIPRPVGVNGTVMPMASRRDADDYETYLARRSSPDAEFEADVERVRGLSMPGRSTVDAFITNDGLLLFFNRSGGEEDGQLYMAWRRSLDEPFEAELPLDVLNTQADDRDPWVDVAGRTFVFSSNRGDGTGLDIYMTAVELPRASDLRAR